ncbi:sulfatase [Streptomyces sp. NPDC059467]|uniref:sulfatase n=1 Tax=Streptomyces sp. NPDC059467 TaxID=3346844 RepID=UPI00368CC660
MKTDAETDADAKAEAENDADVKPDADAENDADAKAEPEPDAKAETDTDAEAETKADTDAETGPEADEATESRTDSAAVGDETGPAAQAVISGRPGWFGWRRRYPRTAAAVRVGTSVLAGAFVIVAIVVPDRLDRLTVQSVLRLPVEAIFLAIVLLALPSKARRIAAVVAGAFLGLSTVLKLVDMGFYQTLARPFDLVFDWPLLTDAADWMKDSFGRAGEVLAVVGVLVLLVAVIAVSALAVLRLADLMARHRPVAAGTTLALGTVWITCFSLSVQFASVPFATKGYSDFLAHRVQYVRDGLGDAKVFAQQMHVDKFAQTPSDQLLTGLRGKDVMFTFIESYGRVAIDDPAMAPQIDATLAEGNARLKAAGFAARSGWLRSPVTGAGSWLAHSTFLSGLWVKNQERYRTLTTSDRATLTSYFQKTGAWRTVGIVPGVRKAWPEGKYFGLDHIYDSTHLGYEGPYFSWTPVPDQFSLEAFQKLEHGKKNRDPIMAEIILASSHNPWSPIAHIIDWKDLGNGKIFYKIKKEGTNPTEVWKSAQRVRTEYRKAIQYSLDSLTQWMQRYGDDNTVLVFLGDHQPVPTVTRGSANRDVPVTIVARDPKVLDRVSDWGWTEGIKPADNAPEWTMDKFRNRFLTAYGPRT